ncbi:alpha-amylase family glycosyl hydrolase [Sphingomicrobium sediminis]|uniref:Alpha-amylase family glycosyl hydrolase n=1 Tax=Sphingomicrobium sediminis TaxID=2950949 RepID=A0A9X2J3H5_9SPHN|nr:alpha-amylase family glycosyl hydrolase [Sphingomicrobium sediminis]MCM8556212.1 alpha-amylase family glycosyl hydrolase [Sphingomicrobium sediminis]
MSLTDLIKRNESAPREGVDDGQPWWKGAVIYQIYPRSFADSNDDGIGDLPGITQRLDHVARLGADAIWISPFFTSPMLDFGYDVAEFRNVDPIFGTLEDFDALVEKAHGLGIKVIIDQVWSHSSDQHRWFEESRQSRNNPKADWYVWADPKPDGTPPNNWQSIFGGPAWTWDSRRGQYYFHNFLKQQPDLNLHSEAVRDEIIAVARFWLERGVDGFRIDAVTHMFHDAALTDNPPAKNPDKFKARSHDFQDNIYNQAGPGTFRFVHRLRELMDEYGAIFSVAEIGGEDTHEFQHKLTEGEEKLNSVYGFDFLYAQQLTPQVVCDALGRWPGSDGEGWPTWAFENHDAPRAVSRWTTPEHAEAFNRMKLMLFSALRGNIIIYQGEELGLTQVDIPYERLQDPEAIANWPKTLSRDGVRTPIPWEKDATQAGFSGVEPWLPIGPDHPAMAVDQQEGKRGSLLEWTKKVIALRKDHPAIRHGEMSECHAQDSIICFTRSAHGEKLLCAFNTGEGEAAFSLPEGATPVLECGEVGADRLGPFAAIIASLPE